MNIEIIKNQVVNATQELIQEAELQENDIFVLGISTSEVKGAHIGKASNLEIGKAVISILLDQLQPKGIFLAVQGCEHINRSLVVERELALRDNLEIVNVVPALHAGGAGSMAFYQIADEPVVVEHITAQAGLDIGDTSIGMHIRHVQVPVRLEEKTVGSAHLTALQSRPKKIGGERAQYSTDYF